MKNKLIIIAASLALAVVLARVFEKPLVAQIRAALVQNVDEPGRNPFAIRNAGTQFEFRVPAGKRYVVENFSALCNVPSSKVMTHIELEASLSESLLGDEVAYAPASFSSGPVSDGSRYYVASGTTHFYANAGTAIDVYSQNAGGGPGNNCDFSVSGYVINNP